MGVRRPGEKSGMGAMDQLFVQIEQRLHVVVGGGEASLHGASEQGAGRRRPGAGA